MNNVESHLLPNGTQVTFYPDTHIYKIGDKELPSITTLLKRVYGDTYSAVNPILLKKSADYGTAVHEELSSTIESRMIDPEFPVISGYPEVNNYFEFIEDIYHVQPLMTEKVAVLYDENNEPIAAGRFDLLCKVNNEVTLADFKTTSTLHRQLVTAQLNLYLKAARQSGYLSDDQVVKLSAIQLSGDTSRLVPIPVLGPKFYLKFFS